jgi:hypothetical protein
MKKQISILAVVFAAVAVVSCSKEKMNEQGTQNSEELTTSNVATTRTVRNPLMVNLEGFFKFDSNLKDATGKLKDGISSARVVSYATDRKGNAKSAVYLDSSYSIKILAVPQQTHTSVSLWFKPVHFSESMAGSILSSAAMGPNVHQPGVQMLGTVATSESTPGDYVSLVTKTWHHAVVTFDGSNVRIYLDNVLRATVPHSASIPSSLSDYFVGKSFVWPLWKGYVDDLRFYSRTLSASDVSALYNQ